MKMPLVDDYLFNKGFCLHSDVEAAGFVPDIVYSWASLHLVFANVKARSRIVTVGL